MTYLETLDAIEAESNVSIKLILVDSLSGLLTEGENPPYERGLEVIASEEDLTVKNALISEIYSFSTPLDGNVAVFFEYVLPDYIENNPGIQGNAYSAYVGVYYSDIGETT